MPKSRKTPGSRQFEKRLLIFCEGAQDRSESAYFKKLIEDYTFQGERVEVKVVDTKKNTGKELVAVAEKCREMDNDSLWVVYDKDGYSKHKETFKEAKAKNVNIAFSSISFEVWILLHFELSLQPFKNSNQVIHQLKHKNYYVYEKNNIDIYSTTKSKIQTAIENARLLRSKVTESLTFNKPVYEMNPYTNIDELILEIRDLSQQ